MADNGSISTFSIGNAITEGAIMSLLWRTLRFFVSAGIRLALALITVAIRVLAPVALSALRSLRNLIFMSMTATVHGPRQYANRLASQWTRQVIEMGASIEYIDEIYSLCHFTVMSMIVSGWIVSVVFTTIILRVVFGYLF